MACRSADEDEALDGLVDADGDGSSASIDCDDADADLHPGAAEVCDPLDVDENCNGLADDEESTVVGTTVWFLDQDGDEFGDPLSTMLRCDPPSGYVSAAGDCNDAVAEINPDAVEICDADAIDEDCDGLSNSADVGAVGGSWWYTDADGDGFGDPTTATFSCEAIDSMIEDGTDCLDSGDHASNVYPGAGEICDDGLNNDCNPGPGGCGHSGEIGLDSSSVGATIYGESGSYEVGIRVTGVGDLNRDGFEDVAVSERYSGGYPNYSGAVHVFFGPVTGTTSVSSADIHLSGLEVEDWFGEQVIAGDIDVDLDGDLDMLVASPHASTTGEIYLFKGVLGGSLDASRAFTTWAGGADFPDFGQRLGVGDLDGDGQEDVVVSADSAVFVYPLANTGGTIDNSSATAQLDGLGGNVATTDLDGDGITDLGISSGTAEASPADLGNAAILLGPLAGSLNVWDEAVAYFEPSASYTYLGNSLALADLNGDGHGDLVLGAPVDESAGYRTGAVFVHLGPFSGAYEIGDAHATLTGERCSLSGNALSIDDFDGDGNLDILVGADGDSSYAGAAYLAYGPLIGTESLLDSGAKFSGVQWNDRSGYAVSSAGDVDSDGVSDILVGAPATDTSRPGAAYLLYGGGS